MKALILVAIGIFVGAFCAVAAVNVLAKRDAHGRAVMVVLAHHLDALRLPAHESDCAAPATLARMAQLRFAARDIDFAFAPLAVNDPAFARRSADFLQRTTSSAPIRGCPDLADWTRRVADGCQACHLQFR